MVAEIDEHFESDDMVETHLDNEMENDGEDGDDSYANAYLDDDDAQESDDAELAEMLAKVQSIQQVEGRLQLAQNPVGTDVKGGQGEEAPAKGSARLSPRVTTVGDARKSQPLVKSPSAASSTSCAGVYKSQDGITTIPRSALSARNAGAGALLGIKKTAVYKEKLLQAVKTTNTIKRLRQKAVAAAPATIGKRIETLSAPPLKSTVRKFATDDEEQHCRFQLRKTAKSSSRDDFDSAGESGHNFISRMEAAERNRQKKLDLSRGENDYNARLDKKSCPKCGVPQSYSEFRDKKKKCQMMTEAARAQAERKEQIYAQVTAEETNRRRVTKTTKQLQYEKRIAMKQNKQTFLDRNYTPNSDSKTKKAQLELEAKRKTGKISRE